jgi:tetratricopeptide (TPR) repeat protein
MKRIVCTTLVVLGLVALAAAQGTASGSGFQLSNTTQRKAPAAPKTPEEGAAYQAIVTNPDLAAAETAAQSFEAKYPQSELGSEIYWNLTYRYQQTDNADKTVEMGRKVLHFDADHPMALVTVASVISERTREADLDRDQRLAEAMKDAQHALDGMERWLNTAPGITDQQAQGMKPVLSSFARASMGMVELLRKNPAEAEKHYRMAVELNPAHPDAVTLLRLALSLDQQKKYAEALPFANQAVELSAPTGGVAAGLAKQEQERLTKLTGQTPPAPTTAPPPKS